MDGRESSGEIERTAAQWLARMDRAQLSGDESARLARWLAGDPRRRGAFVRAKALWMRSEAAGALGPQCEPEASGGEAARAPRPRAKRDRRLVEWGGAMAASFVLAALLAATTLNAPVAYATVKGEMRRVPLSDGSTLTLNTDSRVRVYDDAGRVRVKVERGEVFLKVAAAGKPLLVEVDGRRLGTNGGAFVVRRLEGRPAQVVVQRGAVRLHPTSTWVVANSRLSLPPGHGAGATTSLSPGQLQRELAWRDGKIAFQGETLAEAASEFARYSDTRVVVADPQLASMPVTGLFAADDPVGFGRAVTEVFGADMRQEQERVVLGYPH